MKNTILRNLIWVLVLVGTLPWGCASGPKLQKDGTFSSKAVLLDVAFQRQGDPTLCGAAVLAMLTRYYVQPLPPSALKDLEKEAMQKKGIKGASLEAALKAAGYHTAIFSGSLDKKAKGLYHHLDLHRPVIVMLSSEGAQENHYQLVSGYDPVNSLVSLLDPAKGPLAMPIPAFKDAWGRANFFTLLAVPEPKKDGRSSP